MLKNRIIPCLDVKNGRVVKGINFVDLQDAGDPVEQAKIYSDGGADEICFLDITASNENRGTIYDVVEKTSKKCFVPLTVGGGVRSVEDINKLLNCGADKVSINTAAVQNPDNVVIETESGQTIMTVEIDGMPVTARLDENARPAVVEMMVEHPVLGETLLSAEYTDYVDWPILDVYFPSQIVHRLGGEVVLEMTVSDFYQNPYVIFPTPELLSRSLQ